MHPQVVVRILNKPCVLSKQFLLLERVGHCQQVNLVCLVQEAEALKHHLVAFDVGVRDWGFHLVEVMAGQTVESVFAADTCQLQIVPADIHDLFFLANRHCVTLVAGLHLDDYVALELLEDEVARLQDLLPRLDRLTVVGQAFTPHIHGCAILGRFQVPVWRAADHVAPAIIRLNNLLEENKVFVLYPVDVLRQKLDPLSDDHLRCLLEVFVKFPRLFIALNPENVVVVQVVSNAL